MNSGEHPRYQNCLHAVSFSMEVVRAPIICCNDSLVNFHPYLIQKDTDGDEVINGIFGGLILFVLHLVSNCLFVLVQGADHFLGVVHIMKEGSDIFNNHSFASKLVCNDSAHCISLNGLRNNVLNTQMISLEKSLQKLLALSTKASRWKKGRDAFTLVQWRETMCCKLFKCFTFYNISFILRKGSSVIFMSRTKRHQVLGSKFGSDKCFFHDGRAVCVEFLSKTFISVEPCSTR